MMTSRGPHLPTVFRRPSSRKRFSTTTAALLTLCALLGTADAAARPRYVYPLVSAPVGDSYHVLTTDLDDDGHLDLIVSYGEGPEVDILLGNGDGTYQFPAPYPAGSGATYSALGDFNGDGHEDVAVANYFDGDVSIWLGNGDGTLGPETRVGGNGSAKEVHIGDFDNDDRQDLLIVSPGRVLFGNGDGTFGDPIEPFQIIHEAAVGDFNGDGLDDIATDNDVLLSNGDGTFETFWDLGVNNTNEMFVADLNNDEALDLVVCYPYASDTGPDEILVYLGVGDGTFAAAQHYTVGESPIFIEIADLNEDDLPDLLVSNYLYSPSLSVLLGTGGGQFADAVHQVLRSCAYTLEVADLDGDGHEDLVEPCFCADDVGILFGDGSGTFPLPDTENMVGDDPRSNAVGDLNGDARLDVVTANMGSNDVSVALANGAGSFDPESRYSVGSAPVGVAIGELTGDSHPDLAVANSNSWNVSVLQNDGDGTFTELPALALDVLVDPSSVAVGDFNADEARDLVVTDGAGARIAVLLGHGDGSFENPTYRRVGLQPSSVVVEDLDGDEIQDLAVANFGSATVSILLGSGDGTFTEAPSLDTWSGGPLQVAVGDLNGDLKPDLAVNNQATCNPVCGKPTQVFLGNGDGTFALPIATPEFPGETVLILDVDGDGHRDLLGTPPVSVWLGDGTGLYHTAEYYAGYADSIAGGDFNLDGRMDLVTASNWLPVRLNLDGPDALTFEADRVTLVWPAVTGALTYNVYRGHLSDLVDLDDDGLPDDGYGACMTSLDPDPRDTFFVDAEMPSTEGAGFFYLRSVVDAGGDGGIGTTSAGLPRLPEIPCP